MKRSLSKLAILGSFMASTTASIAGENRAGIRNWAKNTEKRSAAMAGGFVSIPQSGTKKVEEEKKGNETKPEKVETK